MTCTVVQERAAAVGANEFVSRAAADQSSAFAVLDRTWPQPFRDMAIEQVEAAFFGGMVSRGDIVVFSSGSTGRPRGIVRTESGPGEPAWPH